MERKIVVNFINTYRNVLFLSNSLHKYTRKEKKKVDDSSLMIKVRNVLFYLIEKNENFY